MTILVNCPSCRHVRQVPDHDVCLGVLCPYCHNAYMDAVDRPIGGGQVVGSRLSSSSYDVDISKWFAYATAHWSSVVGAVVGFLLLQGLISFPIGFLTVVPFAGPILWLVAFVMVMFPLKAGVIIVSLAQLKGDRWHFGDFFGGFSKRYYWSVVGFTWLMFGMLLVVLTPVWVPLLVGGIYGISQLMTFGLIAAMVFVPVCIYVQIRISFFGPYLIIDRDFKPMEAVQESWDLTSGHFWGLFGVSLLLGLIALGGYLVFGVGLLLAVPFIELVCAAGYLLAGGTRPPMKQPEMR